MDSILVVTYSYTGTSRRLAQMLCTQEGWPLGEVVEQQSRAGASGTWRCVMDSLLRRCPPVRYQGPDPADFRTVVLVTPVWMYRLAGPMRSFVSQYRDVLHRVAVAVTMGSGGALNAFAEISRIVHHEPVLTASFTARSVEDGSCSEPLSDFGDALQPGSAAMPAGRPIELSPRAG